MMHFVEFCTFEFPQSDYYHYKLKPTLKLRKLKWRLNVLVSCGEF